MSSYTIAATLDQPYAALGDQGLGVLAEIDLEAALEEKLDVDIGRNVVVRSLDPATTVEEAFDPGAMMGLADEALHTVAVDAERRLDAVVAALNEEN